MASTTDDEHAIYAQASECVKSFHSLCLIEAEKGQSWAENQKARFQVWAANLGVFAPGHASCDYRLKLNQNAIHIIVQLLKALEANLVYLAELRGDNDRPKLTEILSDTQDEDSASSGDSSLTVPSLYSEGDEGRQGLPSMVDVHPDPASKSSMEVEAGISRLNAIARTIRRSGSTNRDQKAEEFVELDDDGNNRTAFFAQMATRLIDDKFRDANPVLRKALAQSIALRRNRIAYLRRHQNKLARERPSILASTPSILTSDRKAPKPTPSLVSISKPLNIQSIPATSATSASNQVTESVRLPTFSSGGSARAMSVISDSPFKAQNLDIPKPPDVTGLDEFVCPWCSLIYPVKETSKERWNRHVMKDLMPYICLSDDCLDSLKLFRTYGEWMLHIQEAHSVAEWVCVAPSHGPQFFNEELYIQHMHEEHAGTFAPSEMHELMRMNIRPSSHLFDQCPFCNFFPEEAEQSSSARMSEPVQEVLQIHVATHFEELALIAAHWLDEQDDVDVLEGSSDERRADAVGKSGEHLYFDDPPIDESLIAFYEKEDWKPEEELMVSGYWNADYDWTRHVHSSSKPVSVRYEWGILWKIGLPDVGVQPSNNPNPTIQEGGTLQDFDMPSATFIYRECISLLNDVRQLVEVHGPRSLPTARKNDLRHVGENLEAWYEDLLSIGQNEDLDAILESSEHYLRKVRRLLDSIRDILKSVYIQLSSTQSKPEDEKVYKLKSSLITLKTLYDELADDDDIAALKASFELLQGTHTHQFDLPAFSISHSKGKRPGIPGPAPRFSSLSQEFAQPPCEAARDKLMKIKVSTNYSNRGKGPRTIFPVEEVRRVLLEDNTAEKTFHCGCSRCYSHSRILSESRHFDRESLTEKFATTFALLIYLYRSGLISHFQKKGKCLTDVPLKRDNLKFISDLQIPTPDSCHLAIDEIIRDQYMFHLKQFEVWHHSVELGPEEALPISEIQEEGRSAYGTVYSFIFLPGYAGRGYGIFEPQKFARKVFVKTHVTSGIDEFNNLLRIYRKGTSQSTERRAKWRNHIMEALAGYEHGDIYFIIFPFAESTLAKYLRGEADHATLTPRYMWRQMEGVAGGLASMHEPYLSATGNDIVSPSIAFHFDLKPENILIRNGVVMISDFGQSKFRKASLGDPSSGVDSDRVFFNYGPPEHNFSTYDKGAKKKSNYNFDIWSLGGIFSELITFHIKQPAGRQGFLDYRNARRQDDRDAGSRGIVATFFLDEYTVKPSVLEQHESLCIEIEQRSDQTYDGKRDAWLEEFAGEDFFVLITRMLSLITETKQRPKAGEVQEILGLLCRKAELIADRQVPRNLSLQERSDIWQQARNGLLWDELPESFTQMLCYYLTEGAPKPTRCVILMQRLVNRQIQMLLLWHHGSRQSIQLQQELSISHTSMTRQTGVIIDYFGHPPTDAEPVDLTAETPDGVDDSQLDEQLALTCYRIVPVTNALTNCAALLFVNAEGDYLTPESLARERQTDIRDHSSDAFSFQAALTGQYIVSNFSANLQSGEIVPASSMLSVRRRPRPETIPQDALLQIWSDVDLSTPLQRKNSVLSTQTTVEGSHPTFDRVPAIHVAIITRHYLYLFKAEHSKITIPEGNRAQAQNRIVLRAKSSLYLDKIDLQPKNGAIMVNIPEPDKYAKCEEARLKVDRYQDAASFWSTLEYCQRLGTDLEMMRQNNQVRRPR